MKAKRTKKLNNKGMATFEAIPLIVIFAMFVGYALGLWGIVHSATLSSIGARQYAFETLRNRTNYVYHRDEIGEVLDNEPVGFRYHAIISTEGPDSFTAPVRPITVGKKPSQGKLQDFNRTNVEFHNTGIFNLQRRNQKVEFSHSWIMTGYGLCLNPKCGVN